MALRREAAGSDIAAKVADRLLDFAGKIGVALDEPRRKVRGKTEEVMDHQNLAVAIGP